MTSPLTRFTYETFEIRRNTDSRETIKRSGHRLGALAAVRFDVECPDCDKTHEVWSIFNVIKGAYPSPSPMFNNLDDAANFILDVVDLHDWSQKPSLSLIIDLTEACIRHNGIPIRVLTLLDKEAKKNVH